MLNLSKLCPILLLCIGCASGDNCLIAITDYEKDKNYYKAIVEASACINNDPSNPQLYFLRGRNYSNNSQYIEAINDYDKAISLDPKNLLISSTTTHYYRGLANHYLKKFDSAISDFTRALNIKVQTGGGFYLEVNPEYADQTETPYYEIKYYRAVSYYEKQLDSLAEIDFSSALANNYQSDQASLYLGDINLRKGNYRKACNYLQSSISMGNKDAEVMYKKYCISP